MSILAEIKIERLRQIRKEGFSRDHDFFEHEEGVLARAAACYALVAFIPGASRPRYWPWEGKWWKPKDPRRDLIRAATLIVAEIERLDRATKEAAT